ncbi:MAG: hypothetical protein ACJ75J_10000, partial [Cytophagaceae bacterium]
CSEKSDRGYEQVTKVRFNSFQGMLRFIFILRFFFHLSLRIHESILLPMCRRLVFVCVLILLGTGCAEESHSHHPSRAFYYWKTVFNLSPQQNAALSELNVRKIYLKFFDVQLNDSLKPVPVATIRFDSTVPAGIEIVPVVYITNKTMLQISKIEVVDLSHKIHTRIMKLVPKGISFREVQIDCDWSEQSMDNYFFLLRELKKNFSGILIASTIRLHQVKYYRRSGVPPVDRGMLMFYNMGSLMDPSTRNSIFDKEVAKRYLHNFDEYPLKLDVALPVFSWAVLSREGKGVKLINGFSIDEASAGRLEPVKANTYLVKEKFSCRGSEFLPGDMLRFENIGPAETEEAARLILPHLKTDSLSVALFDLNDSTIKNYTTHDFEEIFSIFN